MPGVTCTLMARAQIVSQITTVKNCVRGILKTFGHVLPKKLRATYIASAREIIEGHATLEPILMPMLRTLAATMEQLQVYDRDNNSCSRPRAIRIGTRVSGPKHDHLRHRLWLCLGDRPHLK